MKPLYCEACYTQAPNPVPVTWELIYQSLVCPDCQRRAKAEMIGLANLRGGQYANGKPDPRMKQLMATHEVRGEGRAAELVVRVWERDARGLDTVIGEIRQGDPMDYAELMVRFALEREGLSDYRRAQKMKRIRKAMGYTCP